MSNVYYRVAQLLEYDRVDGTFRWRKSEQIAHNLRGRVAGSRYADGYVYIRFEGKRLLAHRLAWLIVTGRLPLGPIDHVNMDRSDNSIANLRCATVTQNNRNRGPQSNNTSGHKGVTFHKATRKYHAKICVNKKRISLGYFDSVEQAAIAYQHAAKEHHGEFARFN